MASNEASCLLTAHRLLKWNAHVVGVVSYDDPQTLNSYCHALAQSLHQTSSDLISTLVSSQPIETKPPHSAPYFTHQSLSFETRGALNVIAQLAEQTRLTNAFLFIDLFQLITLGNHLATSKRCDKIIMLIPKRKFNEFSLKKKIHGFEDKEKIELVLVGN